MSSIPISKEGFQALEQELDRLKKERPHVIQAIKEAREEGFEKIAFLFEAVGKIEKGHEERYQALLDSLCEGKIFVRPTKVIWECANCGHRVESPKAPEKCPVCDHPQAYFFELQEEF